jgi:hypothetical protein
VPDDLRRHVGSDTGNGPASANEPHGHAARKAGGEHGVEAKATSALLTHPDEHTEQNKLQPKELRERCPELDTAVGLGLELVPAKIEGVRSRARRLAERGWLSAARPLNRGQERQHQHGHGDMAMPGVVCALSRSPGAANSRSRTAESAAPTGIRRTIWTTGLCRGHSKGLPPPRDQDLAL